MGLGSSVGVVVSGEKGCEWGDGVRMAERSKALRSGRSPLLWAWVQIPLLTKSMAFYMAYGGHYFVGQWDEVWLEEW